MKHLDVKFDLHSDGQTKLLIDPEEVYAKLMDHNYSSSVLLKDRRKKSKANDKL